VLIGLGGLAPGTPYAVTALSSGTQEQQVVDYVARASSDIVAHDGSKPVPPAHLTVPYNRRLRRHDNMAWRQEAC
jgi:hypothetical protein